MMDGKGENFYKVTITKSPVIQFCISTIQENVYCETASSVAEAKRNAKLKLEEFGVVFKKEIRFKKHEVQRRELFRKTRLE